MKTPPSIVTCTLLSLTVYIRLSVRFPDRFPIRSILCLNHLGFLNANSAIEQNYYTSRSHIDVLPLFC
jgi:hypothetical protein